MLTTLKKIPVLILISLPLTLAAQTPAARVDTLLAQMPAQSEVVTRLLVRALLQTGAEGIDILCSRVQADSSLSNTRARFALQAISTRLTEVAGGRQQRMYRDRLHESLRQRTEQEVRAFFLQQLQLCGSDDSVKPVAALLHNARLYRQAVRTLQAIGGARAENALVHALASVPDEHKVAIIDGLSAMGSTRARRALAALLDNDDQSVRDAALSALVRSGSDNFLPKIKKTLLAATGPRREALFSAWLDGVQLQFRKGRSGLARQLCRQALAPDSGFTGHERLAALLMFGRNDPAAGLEALLDTARHVQKKQRAAALRVLQELPGEAVSHSLIELTAQLPDSIKPEIYRTLGMRDDAVARKAVVAALGHEDEGVRIAASRALVHSNHESAASELVKTLPDLRNDRELQAWEQALMQLPLRAEKLLAGFSELPVSARIVLLRVAQKRGMSEAAVPARKSLDAENAALRRTAAMAWFELMPVGDIPAAVQFIVAADRRLQRDLIRVLKKRLVDPQAARQIDSELAQVLGEGEPFERFATLRLAARLGGSQSLQQVIDLAQEPDTPTYAAAVRALSAWHDSRALPAVLHIAQTEDNPALQTLAIRAVVRLLSIDKEIEPAEKILLLEKALAAAHATTEKKQALAAAGEVPARYSLAFITRYFSDPELALTAAQTALRVLQKQGLAAEPARAILTPALPDSIRRVFDNQQALLLLNEPPQGFQPLFNGADFTGWLPEPATSWQAGDGLLRFSGTRGRLVTEQKYRNFELLLDWQISQDGKAELEPGGSLKIILGRPDQAGEILLPGSGKVLPRLRSARPAGEWNTLRVQRQNGTVRAWLNDIELVEGGVSVVADSLPSAITLRATGPVTLRSLFLRELPDQPAKFSGKLFNGTDLSGWHEVSEQPGNWHVADGILFTEGSGGGWLATRREFSDFRLELEFRLPEGGNSGVFLRAPLQGNPAYQGLEIQILDDYAEKYAALKPWQYTGSIYALQAPALRVSQKAGVWQKMVIECHGPRIRVQLNGTQIIDADLIDYMHKAAAHPGVKRRRGFVGLQNHGSRVEFRNIFLTELP